MTNKNLCIVSSILIAVSAFLPFCSVSVFGIVTGSDSLIDLNGYYILFFVAVSVISSVQADYYTNFIVGLAALFMLFTDYMDTKKDVIVNAILHYEIGFYLLLAGSIALIVFSWLGLQEKGKNKTDKDDSFYVE